MDDLNTIGIRNGTDKSTVFTRTYAKPHGYLPIYERFFEPLRDKPIKLVEIGVGGGESVKTWLEYFTKAQIFGVDIVKDTNPWNTPGAETNLRYTFNQGDQSCKTFLACWIADNGADWNVVVDDGSHQITDIITTFNALWPHVLKGGFYVVEDLSSEHRPWVKAVYEDRKDVEVVHESNELAIFKKR